MGANIIAFWNYPWGSKSLVAGGSTSSHERVLTVGSCKIELGKRVESRGYIWFSHKCRIPCSVLQCNRRMSVPLPSPLSPCIPLLPKAQCDADTCCRRTRELPRKFVRPICFHKKTEIPSTTNWKKPSKTPGRVQRKGNQNTIKMEKKNSKLILMGIWARTSMCHCRWEAVWLRCWEAVFRASLPLWMHAAIRGDMPESMEEWRLSFADSRRNGFILNVWRIIMCDQSYSWLAYFF